MSSRKRKSGSNPGAASSKSAESQKPSSSTQPSSSPQPSERTRADAASTSAGPAERPLATSRNATLMLWLVIVFSAVGYFVGMDLTQREGVSLQTLVGDPSDSKLGDPSSDKHGDPSSSESGSAAVSDTSASEQSDADPKRIASLAYWQIPSSAMGPTDAFAAAAVSLPQPAYDIFAEVKPSPEAKLVSARLRSQRRMFNGAPPVIPHQIENTNDAACVVCHQAGARVGELKASVMPHAMLTHCTQCHGPPPPAPFADIDSTVQSDFVGLPAPMQGKRASPGAPPTIPHSQWMRENCLACHGGPNGWAGMESTHPWRTHCTQCHAPSAKMDQAFSIATVPMLSPEP